MTELQSGQMVGVSLPYRCGCDGCRSCPADQDVRFLTRFFWCTPPNRDALAGAQHWCADQVVRRRDARMVAQSIQATM